MESLKIMDVSRCCALSMWKWTLQMEFRTILELSQTAFISHGIPCLLTKNTILSDLFSSSCPMTWEGGLFWVYIGTTPHPVTVTTRIITFLIGDPYEPSFVAVTGRGVDLRYIVKITWLSLDLSRVGKCHASFEKIGVTWGQKGDRNPLSIHLHKWVKRLDPGPRGCPKGSLDFKING